MKEQRQTRLVAQLGWAVALWLFVPMGLGLWLDSRLATSPLLAALAGMVGIVGASIFVVRMTTSSLIKTDKSSRAEAQNETKDREGEGLQ